MRIKTEDKKNMMYTGIRISEESMKKSMELAKQLGVSRNRLIEILIECAEIKSQPVVKVILNA